MDQKETARVMQQWRTWIKSVEAAQHKEMPRDMEPKHRVLLQKDEIGYAAA